MDELVTRDGTTLAVHDHGGDGPPILCLPGAGRTLLDFVPLAERLTPTHRVVSMDLRCHGLSSDGAWVLDEVLADIDAVIAHAGLQRPAIVGHSLGGMLAALEAERPGVLSAAVNLDGHGMGKPEQYEGMSVEEATAGMAELMALSQGAAAPAVLDADTVASLRESSRPRAEALGLPGDLSDRIIERTLRALPDGTFQPRPDAAAQKELMAAIGSLDLLALYARTTVPLLVYNATAQQFPPGLPDWAGALLASYRSGLRRALAQLAAEHPLVSVIEIDATHDLHLEATDLVAEQVLGFLDAAAARS